MPRSALLNLEIPVLPGSARCSPQTKAPECARARSARAEGVHMQVCTRRAWHHGHPAHRYSVHRCGSPQILSTDGSSPQWAELQPLECLTLARLHLQLARSQPVLECSPALELVPRLSQPHHPQTLPVSALQPPASPTLHFQMIPKPDDLSGESCSSR